MDSLLAVLIGGAVLAVAGVVIFLRATRPKPVPVDPIAATTGLESHPDRHQRHR